MHKLTNHCYKVCLKLPTVIEYQLINYSNLTKLNCFKKLGVLLYVLSVYPVFFMEVCAIRRNVVNVHPVSS